MICFITGLFLFSFLFFIIFKLPNINFTSGTDKKICKSRIPEGTEIYNAIPGVCCAGKIIGNYKCSKGEELSCEFANIYDINDEDKQAKRKKLIRSQPGIEKYQRMGYFL